MALTSGPGHVRRACVKRYPAVWAMRSKSDGGGGGSDRGTRRLQATPLLSMAVKSPELKQTRARVAPGSPESGREEEGATTNSMAGKRP
jgi:hypothetical protein